MGAASESNGHKSSGNYLQKVNLDFVDDAARKKKKTNLRQKKTVFREFGGDKNNQSLSAEH